MRERERERESSDSLTELLLCMNNAQLHGDVFMTPARWTSS